MARRCLLLQPAAMDSRVVLSAKRKRSPGKERCVMGEFRKRSRTIRSTSETTRISDRRRTLHSSNRFEAFLSRSSFRTLKKERRRKYPSRNDSRKWVFSPLDCSTYKDRVVIVSYNILGVDNALKHPDLYFNVPPKFLEWNQRKKIIREEIIDYNASILCFQEVDRFNDLVSLFGKDGYKGIYKARTGEACDGCAIFWKEKLFTLLHQENIDFQSFDLRHNVAQLCILKMNHTKSESNLFNLTSNRCLLIGNIHVLFNPNRGDIKLGQMRLFLERAYKLSKEWGNMPVILAGDLNSIPKSAIYQFLSSSELNVQSHDRRNISGQLEFSSHFQALKEPKKNSSRPFLYAWSDEELRTATGSESVTHIQHHLKLNSAYLGIPGSVKTRDINGEPLVTSYHSKFMGTVDYIWHSADLVPVRVLETLPVKILRKTEGLPNKKYGSDHLALVCELAFADSDS